MIAKVGDFLIKHILLFLKKICFGTSSEKKRYFVEKIPILGEGGGVCPRGNYSHIIPFFSEDVPKVVKVVKVVKVAKVAKVVKVAKVDKLNKVDKVERVDKVVKVDKLDNDKVAKLDKVDRVDKVDKVD